MNNTVEPKEARDKPVLQVRGLVKTFHSRRAPHGLTLMPFWPRLQPREAIKDVTFNIQRGQFVGLIGKNGSGKSTLLRLISGILTPNLGTEDIRGTVCPCLALGPAFHGDLSAVDNLHVIADMFGYAISKRAEMIRRVIRFAELEDVKNERIRFLSAGMRTRLSLAMVLDMRADLYLFDEVFAGGDLNYKGKCLSVFDKWRKEGRTLLLATHRLPMLQDFDSVIVLDNGGVVGFGTPEDMIELYTRLRHKRGAEH